MRTIRISEEVWDEIAERGKFGETPDDVLRRVFQIGAARNTTLRVQTKFRQRYATRRMSTRIENGHLVVEFQSGPAERWPLPAKDDINKIRVVRDQAVNFASKHGATEGQENAVKKALTEAGFYVSR